MRFDNKPIFKLNIQPLWVLVFAFISLNLMADPAAKNPSEILSNPPLVDENTGDFLPDSVNVFKIAKDVSRIFSEAVQFSSLNDKKADTSYLEALFTSNYATNEVANAYKNDVAARIKSQKGDIGVSFAADYSENFKPGFSPDEDIYYKRRFYFGVEWNVIKGGFLASRAKANQLEKEYYLKDIDAKKRADAENYRYIFNYINYIFNKEKITVLKERYSLIDKQLKYTTELYHLRYIGWEDVLKIRAKLEDLNQQIGQLENFNKHIPNSIPDTLLNSNYSAEKLPLVDIDLDKLMKIYHNNETTDTIAAIKLAMYKEGMKWWQDVSLKPYLRYNLYIDPLNASRRFGAGGISLKVPLRFKHKNDLISAQEAIYKAEGNSVNKAGDNELVNLYAEFAFKLKQIKAFYFKKLSADELIRKELVKKDYHDIGFNPIFTLGLIDDKKNVEAEIIDIKKRLYIQLVQMAFYLDKKSPLDFVEIVHPGDFSSRYATGVQIFIDQNTIQSMKTEDLVNYLWKNEFKDVVLEVNSWQLSPKVKAIIAKASRDQIYFTLSLKIPKGQTYPNLSSDLQKIKSIDNPYVNGLHYALALNTDTTSAPEIREVNFSDWLNGIDVSSKPKNIRLSISISDDLPINILNKVYSKFDLVFIPSDGTPNRKKLENKLTQELALGKDKLTVVLNANDFADRMHIENYMSNLNSKTGLENFAFSNLKSMIHADLRSYEAGEHNKISTADINAAFRNQIFADDAKNKAVLNAKLDTISALVDENNKQAQIQPSVSVEITDKTTSAKTTKNQKAATAKPRVTKTMAVAKKETTNKSAAKPVNAKKWQIQFAAAKVNLSEKYLKNKFKVIDPIHIFKVNEYNKYTIGSYSTESAARAALKDYKSQSGNTSAFIVSYE